VAGDSDCTVSGFYVQPLSGQGVMIMNNDSLVRLAATLDRQCMSGACHQTIMSPVKSDSLFKRALNFLASRMKRLFSNKPKDPDHSRGQ
jgi:hypothetical protein